jgi:LytS/YehU family sensor histidine kinase
VLVGERLLLRVADDGPGPPSAADATHGVGLSNTKARLESLYGDGHRFALRRADGGGCVVRIELPFHTHPATDLALPDPDETTPEASLSPAPVSP